jgi:hypothetical protein
VTPDGHLPADIAAGPLVELWAPDRRQAGSPTTDRAYREREAEIAWSVAGREWSLANGHSWNGWMRLLPPDLVPGALTRRRLRKLEA